jgi:hypothetical protein
MVMPCHGISDLILGEQQSLFTLKAGVKNNIFQSQ